MAWQGSRWSHWPGLSKQPTWGWTAGNTCEADQAHQERANGSGGSAGGRVRASSSLDTAQVGQHKPGGNGESQQEPTPSGAQPPHESLGESLAIHSCGSRNSHAHDSGQGKLVCGANSMVPGALPLISKKPLSSVHHPTWLSVRTNRFSKEAHIQSQMWSSNWSVHLGPSLTLWMGIFSKKRNREMSKITEPSYWKSQPWNLTVRPQSVFSWLREILPRT
jgi:hypothetical protein